MVEKTDYDKLRLLMQLVHSEQNFYWQRFAALTTLHAGLFVLATAMWNRYPSNFVIALLSAVLAVFWIAVQFRSLQYVKMYKPAFHVEREKAGIEQHGNPLSPWWASTRMALAVPILVFIAWIVVIASALW